MATEKRKFNRWYPADMNTSIMIEGKRDEVKVADVCATGMKVLLSQWVNLGTEVIGTLRMPMIEAPFYVRGPVVRQQQNGGRWESAIQFSRVSVNPF